MAKTPRAGTQQSAIDVSNAEIEKAVRFLRAGDIPKAAAVLDALQKRVQGDPRVYLLAMQIAEASGRPEAALEAVRLAVKLAPNWPLGRMELAMCLGRQGQLREAAEEAERALALAPDDPSMLNGAIQIAQRAGFVRLAVKHLPRLIELTRPRNAPWKILLANDLMALNQPDEARALFDELLADSPDEVAYREGRARAALAAGDLEAARSDWAALCALQPDNASYRFALAQAEGQTPATRPAVILQSLFDDMAPIYDQRMVRDMGYRLPKDVADWVLSTYPERKLNVLDLGCGTGLLGVCLGRLDGALVGVDISAGMIAQAERHQVYDRFHHVDLLDALRDTPDGLYDLLAALDVFSYVGDLGQALGDAARLLKPGGRLVVSCEAARDDEGALALRPTGRYVHRKASVESLFRDAGFAEVDTRDCQLHVELGRPVDGYWIVARKA